MKQLSFEVIVVGGGLVGQLTALMLEKKGYNVALVEQRCIPDIYTDTFDNRSIALSNPSIAMLQHLGLWESIFARATAIDKIHVSDKGQLGHVNLSAVDEKLECFGRVVEMPHLLSALSKELKQSTVKILAPVTVVTLQENELGSRSLIVKDEQHQEIRLDAPLICACDGAHSEIRKSLDVDVVSKSYQQMAVTFNVALKRDHLNIAYERFIGSGVVAMLPLSNRRSACIWTMSIEEAEATQDLNDDQVLKQIQTIFGYRLGRLVKLGKRGAFPLHLIYSKQLYRDNVLLMGNAAHYLHPISGQGFNLSFRDVGILHDVLNEYGLKKNNTKLLEIYEYKRLKDHKSVIQATNGLVETFLLKPSIARHARGSALSVLERSTIGKKVVSQFMSGKFDRLPTITQIHESTFIKSENTYETL